MNCIKIHNSLPKEAAEIRQKVFVEEQKFENEFDDIDKIRFTLCFIKTVLPRARQECLPRTAAKLTKSAELPFCLNTENTGSAAKL